MKYVNWALTIFWSLWLACLGWQLNESFASGKTWLIILYAILIAIAIVGVVFATLAHYNQGKIDVYKEIRDGLESNNKREAQK